MPSLTVLKALVQAGYGARRQAARAIMEGRVLINGEPAQAFSQLVDTDSDHISLDGKPVQIGQDESIYLLLNKPPGVLSTTRDERGRQTVIDLLPPRYHGIGLYPVGRLDLNSRGLVLLTNDGKLAYRLTHPRFDKEKEYAVKLERALSDPDLHRFAQGLQLEDGMTSPARIRGSGPDPLAYSVIIHEGRKRQLRRMFQAVGYNVTDLKRVRLGSLKLGDLKEGFFRELSPGEVSSLRGD